MALIQKMIIYFTPSFLIKAYLKSVRDNSPMCFSKDAVARKEIQDLTEELINRIGG